MCADHVEAIGPDTPIEISVAGMDDTAAWELFVRASNDGTLHHQLGFLAYHPAGRFQFTPLIARRGGEIVAVLPGGIADRENGPRFVSPLGASVGGPIVASQALIDTLDVVQAFQNFARASGWSGLEFVLGPGAYRRDAGDVLSFALFSRGFQLIERDLSFVIPIDARGPDAYATLFRKKQAWGVRSAGRRGVTVRHGGAELLEDFFVLFRETYDRHGQPATHSEAEIADLITRLPGRIEVTIAALAGAPLAGLLVFRLNDQAAQTFYICSNRERAKENGTVAAIASLIDRLAGAGVRFLDLGPSASSQRMNEGVVFFKEGLGARGQTRDRWSWDAPVS